MRRARAFTLIELLVVISIIALLISILLPALHKSRDSAKHSLCLANQRQIITAAVSYAVDEDGNLPPCIVQAWPSFYSWPDYLNYHANAPEPTTNGGMVSRFLKPYINNAADVFICPLAPQELNNYNQNYTNSSVRFLLGSYFLFWNYNGLQKVSDATLFRGPSRLEFLQEEERLLTSDTLAFHSPAIGWYASHLNALIAANPQSVNNPLWQWPGDASQKYSGLPVNSGYVDGHVTSTAYEQLVECEHPVAYPHRFYLPERWK